MNQKVTCGECRFWIKIPWFERTDIDDDSPFSPMALPEGTGTCHRHAPLWVPDASSGVWPKTNKDDFCGEGEKRDGENLDEEDL